MTTEQIREMNCLQAEENVDREFDRLADLLTEYAKKLRRRQLDFKGEKRDWDKVKSVGYMINDIENLSRNFNIASVASAQADLAEVYAKLK